MLCVMGAVGTHGPVPGWGLGLAKSTSPQTQEVAFQLAQNWIRTNFDVYSQKSVMYEKVSSAGSPPVALGSSPQVWREGPEQWRHPVAIPGHCRGRGCGGVTALCRWLPWGWPGGGWDHSPTFSPSSWPQYDISNGGQPGGGGEYEVQVSGLSPAIPRGGTPFPPDPSVAPCLRGRTGPDSQSPPPLPSCVPTSLTSVQEGFGWTNGVALMFLDRYGDRLSSGTQLTTLAPQCLTAALLLNLLLR